MASDTTGFRVLCRTRWTIRASSLKSVLDNYVVLQELWEVSQGCTSDPAYKGRIIGVEAQDKKLQSQTFSAAEGELMARMTSLPSRLKATLHYKAQWILGNGQREKNEVNVDEPQLPRHRKQPRHFESGTAERKFFEDPKLLYQSIYYKALDLIISSVSKYIETFKMPVSWSSTLRSSVQATHATVAILHWLTSRIISAAWVTKNEWQLISEVVTVLTLMLMIPATNAIIERSFSAMRRLKTYLRATIKQDRLNHLLLLQLHKEQTDALSLPNK